MIAYDKDLSGVIMHALTMTNDEYQKMKLDLERVCKDVAHTSLRNLQNRLRIFTEELK